MTIIPADDVHAHIFLHRGLSLPSRKREREIFPSTCEALGSRVGVSVSLRSYKSVDGRTTPLLCGTNPPTPQPASPDPGHCPLLHDYSHVPSPMSPASPDTTSNPHTPCSRDSHRLLSSEDTRCSTPDFTFEERVRGGGGGCGPRILLVLCHFLEKKPHRPLKKARFHKCKRLS